MQEIDYGLFLSPSFEPRSFAQDLLNGPTPSSSTATGAAATSTTLKRDKSVTHAHPAAASGTAAENNSTQAEQDKPWSLDARSLEALQQLGLATNATTATRSNGIIINKNNNIGESSANLKNNSIAERKNSAIASLPYNAFSRTSSGPGDVSAALSKLSFAVDDLNKQLRSETNTHHAALLVQAGSVSSLEDNLRQIRGGLDEVESSVDRLRRKIAIPYTTLSTSLTRLEKLQRASDLAKRAGRFVVLARRLDVQMAELNAANTRAAQVRTNGASASGRTTPNALVGKDNLDRDGGERALSEAALTLAELDILMDVSQQDEEGKGKLPSIRSIHAISHHIPAVEANRARVVEEMEIMVRRGLQELNQGLLASSLQTAYNLAVLPNLVASLVQDLIEAIESRIKYAFDVSAIARDALTRAGEPLPQANSSSSVFYKSRARTEPTSSNLPHFQAALWHKLDGLIEDMAGCCIKVYVLEHVLKLKKDPVTQNTFLDDALTVLDNKPTFTFWTTLSQSFELHAKEASRASTFVQQTLSVNYPRFLRLFHDFFSKIALQCDTVYMQNQQSPETVLILRSIATFESLYLSRSTNRMNEAIGSAFSGGSRSPPSSQDGMTTARVLSNELDAARFDPLLVKNVARNAAKAIDNFVDRAEGLIVTDYTSTSLAGPLPTGAQQLNAEVVTALYHFWSPLNRILASYPANIQELLKGSINSIRTAVVQVVTPLATAIRREVATIIARMHQTGFNKPMDPTNVSVYMQALSDKLNFIRRQLLASLRIGEMKIEWVTELCKFTFQRFVLHASIVNPLGEGGKLKLTTDCTTLEFAVSQLLGDYKLNLMSIGDDFRALRAFRPVLFSETAALSDPAQSKDLPVQILYHHLLVRAGTLQLPHQIHRWTEAEYCKFVSEHTPVEGRRLVEGSLKDWEEKGRPGEDAEAGECVAVLRSILEREKQTNPVVTSESK